MNEVMQQLWGALPLIAFGGWVVAQQAGGRNWTESLMRVIPWWAGAVWVLSNGLGLFGALNPGALRFAWIVLAVAALVQARSACKRRVVVAAVCEPAPFRAFERVLMAASVVLIVIALVTAVMAPPSTVDVLNYHGPRQLMWLQQGSLAHFLTVNDRQLMMPPLAEVIDLQFLALTGGDY
jgi:hypothetical protein